MPSSHHDAHPYGRSSDDVRRRDQRVRRIRRLRLTQLVFFSVVALALVAVGAYALQELRTPPAEPGVIAEKTFGTGAGEVTCPEPGALPLEPADVQVTVLNGTSRSGFAGRIAEDLTARGYTVAETGNTSKAGARATIVYGPEGYLAALSVQAQVGEAELRLDDREGTAVDLLLGEGISNLTEEAAASAALAEPAAAPEGCAAG